MFDLFRNRESSMRSLLVVLLSLIALSMVVTLIPGFGSPSMDSEDDQVLAVVGDHKVMARDIRGRIDELVRGQRLPPQLVSAYVPQLVDAEIEDRAQALMSQMLGNQISDDELARVIRGSLPSLFEGGVVDKARYREAVASMGKSVSQFEEDLRLNQLGLMIRNMAEESAIVSPADVEAEYRRRNVKLKVDYIAFSAEKLKSTIVPEESDLRALYNNGKEAYPIPEKRSFIGAVADEAQLAAGIEVPDEELKAEYNRSRRDFETPERVRARHILVMTQGKPDSEKPALLKKAQDLLKQIKGGADFAELAKKNSDDTTSAVKGGDLDWFGRGRMVPQFEAAVFSLKPGQVSEIVTTDYGYHIIRVDDKELAGVKPFEEVRNQLIINLRRNKAMDLLQKTLTDARNEVVKNPGQIEAIAAKYHMQIVKADHITPSGSVPGLAQAADLVSAVFATPQGGVTQIVQPVAGKHAFAVVTGIEKARVATFEEARDRIRDTFQQVKAQEVAERKAKEAAAQLLTPGADWKAIAKNMGAELKSSAEFAPDGSIDGLGGASMLGDLLNKPVGAAAGPISIVGQWAIVRIAERIEPDPAKLNAERTIIQMNLKQKASQARYSLIRDSILNTLIEKGKVKKNKRAIERLLASYTT